MVVNTKRILVAAQWPRVQWQGLGTVLLLFFYSRLAFYMAAFLGTWLLPEDKQPVKIPIRSTLALALHWRWDAIHYYSIATGGYHHYYRYPMPGNNPDALFAFFPLQPFLVRMVATLLNGLERPAVRFISIADPVTLLAGILVTHAAALLAFWLLFKLVRHETGDEAIANRAVLYMAMFPLAFYYAVPYAEPLFLAASLGAFLSLRQRRWVRAGLWIAAASAARPFGILLVPVLAVEIIIAWRNGDMRWRDWLRAAQGMLLAPLGLLVFMFHLWLRTGDALAFAHVQQTVWQRETVFPLVTLWRGIGYLLHPSWSSAPDTYARTILHTLIVILFLLVFIISARRWRLTYVVYGTLLFIQILSVPWPEQTIMHTLGRSVMIFFPVYITLARWGSRPAIHNAIMLVWLPLFGLLTALYVRWYFVA